MKTTYVYYNSTAFKKYSSVNKPDHLFSTMVQYANKTYSYGNSCSRTWHEAMAVWKSTSFIIYAHSFGTLLSFYKLWTVTSPSIQRKQQRKRKHNSKPMIHKEQKFDSLEYLFSFSTSLDSVLGKIDNKMHWCMCTEANAENIYFAKEFGLGNAVVREEQKLGIGF